MKLANLKNCKHIEFLCSELEYENPNLEITGVDFKSDEAINRLSKKSQDRVDTIKNLYDKYSEKEKIFKDYFKKRAEFISQNNF